MVNFNPSGVGSHKQPDIDPLEPKLANLKTYARNPASLKDKIISLFTGVNKYIGIGQEGHRRYVSTKELSEVLNVTPKRITEEYKSHGRSIDGLIRSFKTDIINKHTWYLDDSEGSKVQKNLENVVDRIGDINFISVYNKSEEKDVMMNTLDQIGDDLNTFSDQRIHKAGIRDENKVKLQYGYTITNRGNIYIRTSMIGRGGFKEVKKSVDLNTSQWIAGFRLKDQDAIRDFDKEMGLMKLFKERKIPNTVNSHKVSYIQNGTKLKAFAYGDLYTGDGRGLTQGPWKETLQAAKAVADTYSAMHKNRIVHHDGKLENLLIRKNDKGQLEKVVVSDYGLSQEIGATIRFGANSRYRYYPPEIHKNPTNVLVSPKTDSYSFGIMLTEMIFGELDWNRPDWIQDMSKDQIKKMFEESLEDIKLNNLNMSKKELASKEKLFNLIVELLDPDPVTRADCHVAKAVIDSLV